MSAWQESWPRLAIGGRCIGPVIDRRQRKTRLHAIGRQAILLCFQRFDGEQLQVILLSAQCSHHLPLHHAQARFQRGQAFAIALQLQRHSGARRIDRCDAGLGPCERVVQSAQIATLLDLNLAAPVYLARSFLPEPDRVGCQPLRRTRGKP